MIDKPRKKQTKVCILRGFCYCRGAKRREQVLAAARSRSRENNAPCCFLTRSRRFATPPYTVVQSFGRGRRLDDPLSLVTVGTGVLDCPLRCQASCPSFPPSLPLSPMVTPPSSEGGASKPAPYVEPQSAWERFRRAKIQHRLKYG